MNTMAIDPSFVDSVEIYEIVRIALSNKLMFERIMDEMDINESELERILNNINRSLIGWQNKV